MRLVSIDRFPPSKRHAAYVLGLLSRTRAKWLAVAQGEPSIETATMMRALFTEMKSALRTFYLDLPSNAYRSLKKHLKLQRRIWNRIFDMTVATENGENRLDMDIWELANYEAAPGLIALTDAAAKFLGEDHGWYRLGIAIGSYQVQVRTMRPTDSLPHFDEIVTTVQDLEPKVHLYPKLLLILQFANGLRPPNLLPTLQQIVTSEEDGTGVEDNDPRTAFFS